MQQISAKDNVLVEGSSKLYLILGSVRPAFLLITPISIALGVATAVWEVGRIEVVNLLLVLVGALSAHISVNTFNEYLDFKSGLDFYTRPTPFSGGSGTLPKHPQLATYVLTIALLSLLLTMGIGVYFCLTLGWTLLPIGLLGCLIIVSYTSVIARQPLSSLIAPGLGCGPLMVVGTHVVLTGSYSWTAFVASLVPFFLINNLLLLNQFPDIEADKKVGRRNFPIVLGEKKCSYIYSAFTVAAFLILLFGILAGVLPRANVIVFVALLIAIPCSIGVLRFYKDSAKLLVCLKLNVLTNLITPSLMSIAFFMS